MAYAVLTQYFSGPEDEVGEKRDRQEFASEALAQSELHRRREMLWGENGRLAQECLEKSWGPVDGGFSEPLPLIIVLEDADGDELIIWDIAQGNIA